MTDPCICGGRLVETHRIEQADGTRDIWFRWVRDVDADCPVHGEDE